MVYELRKRKIEATAMDPPVKARNRQVKKASQSAVKAWLGKIKISDLPKRLVGGRVISITPQDMLANAYQIMSDNHILAIPVCDHDEPTNTFIDVLDIMAEVLKLATTFTTNLDGEAGAEELALFSEPILGALKVQQAAGVSGRDPWVPVMPDITALEAAEHLCHRDVHRLPVVDDNKVVGLITQTDLCIFFLEHLENLGDKANLKVKNMTLTRKGPPVTVRETDTTVSAFRKLVDEGVSFAAVVNARGSVVEAFSATDLKPWNQFLVQDFPLRFTDLSGLAKPVGEFMEARRNESRQPRRRVLTCTGDSTIRDLLTTFVHHHVHHVAVVNEKDHTATGVVSLRDILANVLA